MFLDNVSRETLERREKEEVKKREDMVFFRLFF